MLNNHFESPTRAGVDSAGRYMSCCRLRMPCLAGGFIDGDVVEWRRIIAVFGQATFW